MDLVNAHEVGEAVRPIINDALTHLLTLLADTRAHLPGELSDALRKTLNGMKITIEFPPKQ